MTLRSFNLIRLQDELVAAAIPAISIVSEGSIQISYEPEATPQQISDGDSILAAFDFSEAATDEWLENKKPERKDLRENAEAAILQIDDFLANPSPTAAEIVQAVRGLARNQKRIIRRLVQID